MELLPSTPASQLVTRDDMHANTTMLRGEMSELRGEMSELRAEVRSDFADLKASTERLIIGGMAGNAIAVVVALIS